MKMLKKILLPTDYSGSSQGAINMAITLSKNYNTEIFLLHVIELFTNSKALMDEINKNVHYQLTTVQEYMRKEGVKTAEPFVLIGNNYDHIINLSVKLDVNLILMGSGEKGIRDRFKLGVTAGNVIRNSNIPVWVVKNQTPASVQKIVCPVDFSWSSERALKNAIQLAQVFKAKLNVLNVIEPMAETFLGMGSLLESEQQLIAENQRFQFDRFLKKFDFNGIEYSKEVAHGKPAQEILNRITSHANRLLVMGTTGQSDVSNILMGSVTEKVVREVPCSFITLKTTDSNN
jgi:universal stress protein E